MNTITTINGRPARAHGEHQIVRRVASGLTLATIFGISVLLLVGCDNTFSIFQTISQEKKQTGADLFLNTQVRAMANDSTNYYTMLAQVFYRDRTGTAWNVLLVNGASSYFASGLASDAAGTVYVAKSDSNNVLDDIYSTVDQGKNWTAMHASAAASAMYGNTVDWLACANNVLFVAAHDSSMNYTLFCYDASSSSFKATGVAGSGDTVLKGVVYDGTGLYWAITASDAYRGASPAAMAKENATGNPTLSLGLLSIATDGAGRILVTRSDGYAYSYSSGVWSNFQVKASTKLGPAFFVTQPVGSERILVAKGVASYGYMEYNETGPATNDAGSNYVTTSSSIYYGAMLNKTVLGFWQPSDSANVLFVLLGSGGTDSYALYRNKFDVATSKWSGWTAE